MSGDQNIKRDELLEDLNHHKEKSAYADALRAQLTLCESECETLKKQHIVEHFNTGHMYQSRLDALLHVQSVLKTTG